MPKTTGRQARPIVIFIIGILGTIGCAGGNSDSGDGGVPPGQQQAAVICGPVIDIPAVSSTTDMLTASDCTVDALFPGSRDFTFIDRYRVTLPLRGKLTIRMNSTEFDTFLVLLPSPLQLPAIAIDDDGGGGTDSLISMYLDAGTYSILANSALLNPETGSYILTTTYTSVTPARLTVGLPLPGRVERNEETSYEAAVIPGTRYTVSITGLTDHATLGVLGGINECTALSATSSPKECTVTAAGSLLTIRADGHEVIGTAADYVVMVVPAPVVTFPITETSGSIPPRVPIAGLVGTRGASRYFATGLTPGTHIVSMTGLTDDADLHVFSDETYSFELDCTLRRPGDVTNMPEDCTLTTTSTLYFSVSSGELARDGAGYIILVW
jgi:hypothetical protein